MKVLVELLILILLLRAGWNQPYRQHAERIFRDGEKQSSRGTSPLPTVPRLSPEPTPAPNNEWLWKRTKLDPNAR